MVPIIDEIRASELTAWANRYESAQWLPSLLRQLVLSVRGRVTSCRFLTHEETNLGGWDGIVTAQSAGLNVPAGTSYWELSKQSNAVSKAKSDTNKRNSISRSDRKKGTLVIVTPRVWPSKVVKKKRVSSADSKRNFEAATKRKGGWKAVVVLDAVVLADWLAQSPGPSLWFAELMQKSVRGAQSLVAHWESLAALKDGILPSVFLAGRTLFVDAMNRWLESGPTPFEVQTTSILELKDAISAWWEDRRTKGELSKLYPVAVHQNDAWNYLSSSSTPLLLVWDKGFEPSIEQIALAKKRGHYVVCRVSNAVVRSPGASLQPLNRDALAEALKSSGFGNDAAWKVASSVAGSGVVLKSHLFGTVAEPPWAKGNAAELVAPIVLLGAWDQESNADQEIVSSIWGKTYPKIEKLLMKWADEDYPLVRNQNSKWRVVAWEYAWRFLVSKITIPQLNRFLVGAKKVLSEVDPARALPKENRPFAGIYGVKKTYSSRLKNGLAEALCLLVLRTEGDNNFLKMRSVARSVVATVLKPIADWSGWASLGYAVVYFAEACPDLILEKLESDLNTSSPSAVALLGESSDGIFGGHPHVNLMWALETMLWQRKYVLRATIVLARMAASDPGGRSGPRPFDVLRSAFLPWYPQCCLNVADRCSVLDRVFKSEPDVAWRLLLSLLPKPSDVSSPRHRPMYLSIDGPTEPKPTLKEYWDQVSHVILRLIEGAGANINRWEELLEKLSTFPEKQFVMVIEEIGALSVGLNKESRWRIWDALREQVARHRYFASAKWAMPEVRLAKIDVLVCRLEPDDAVLRYAWLFRRSHGLNLPGTDCDTSIDAQDRTLEHTRELALREIIRSGGLESVNQLVILVGGNESGKVGQIIARKQLMISDGTILPEWLESEHAGMVAFARGYSDGRLIAGGWEWLLSLKPKKWKPQTFAQVATLLPFRSETWRSVSRIGKAFENAYWNSVCPWLDGTDSAEVADAVTEFTERKRAEAALRCINSARHHRVSVSVDTLITVLKSVREAKEQASTDEDRQCSSGEAHDLSKIFLALQGIDSLTPNQLKDIEDLEWFFLPGLDYLITAKFLHARLQKEPRFFVSVLSRIYRPKNSSSKRESTESERRSAENANRLLGTMHEFPGLAPSSTHDEAVFLSWVSAVRHQAKIEKLKDCCEHTLGELMLASPADTAGFWPCAPVCRLLTDSSEEMREAFEVALMNNQGSFDEPRSLLTMSSQNQRSEACDKLSEMADKLDLAFPVVAEMMRKVSGYLQSINERGFRDEEF